jgi:hypothetical protein
MYTIKTFVVESGKGKRSLIRITVSLIIRLFTLPLLYFIRITIRSILELIRRKDKFSLP